MLGGFEYAMAFDDVGVIEPFEGGDWVKGEIRYCCTQL